MVTKMRMVRIAKGITLRDLAAQQGFSEVNMYRLDEGTGYCPPRWREPLAKALNVPTAQLWDSNGWPLLVTPGSVPVMIML